MSWLYGQTWLWYLIAFLVGVLLAWLFLVRPQQRRLAAPATRPAVAAGAAAPAAVADAEPVTEEFEPVTKQFEPVTEQLPAVDPALSTLDSARAAREDTVVIEPAAPHADEETVVIPPATEGDDVTTSTAATASAVDANGRVTHTIDAHAGEVTPEDRPIDAAELAPGGSDGPGDGPPAPGADEQPAAGTADPSAAPATTGALGIAGLAATGAGTAETPYGPGSARPAADGSSPHADYTIKGNAGSMLYHSPESPYYVRTRAEVWFTSADVADAAGFQPWNRNRKRAAVQGLAATFEPGRYPGSAKPRSDGSAPTGAFTIKGNEDSMLYHLPSSPYYGRTRAEVWFSNEADAEAAGFTQYRRKER